MENLTYNGYTLEQISSRLNTKMVQAHKDEYLNNVKEVISNENAGFNLDYCQSLRNRNFLLTTIYLNK